MKTPIRILIVEDEPPIARNLQQILMSRDYSVTGMAFDMTAAYDKLAQGSVDLVLLDINLNGQFNGLEIAETLHTKYRLPFIFITSYADADTLDRAKQYQPVGYVVKPFTEDEIFAAVEVGWHNYTAAGADRLSLEYLNARISEPLTEREFDILQDVIKGLPYKEIAGKHYVSVNTVSTHIKKIYTKLHVHSRGALTEYIRTLR